MSPFLSVALLVFGCAFFIIRRIRRKRKVREYGAVLVTPDEVSLSVYVPKSTTKEDL